MKKLLFSLAVSVLLVSQFYAATPSVAIMPALTPLPVWAMAYAMQSSSSIDGLLVPEMFGAVGDDATDDADEFRKLNTAVASRPGTRVVMRPNKTYRLTLPLRSSASIRWDLNGATLHWDITGNCLALQPGNFTTVENGTIDVDITGHTSTATGDVGSPIVVGDDWAKYNANDCVVDTGFFGTEPHDIVISNMTLTGSRTEGFCAFCIFSGYNITARNINCPASNKLAICVGVTAGVNNTSPTSKSYHPYNVDIDGVQIGAQTYVTTSPFEPGAVAVSGARSGISIRNVNASTITDGPLLRFSASDQGISRLGVRAITAGGTGYSNAMGVATTGGSGSGLTVDITTSGGAVTAVTINSKGSGGWIDSTGYLAGETLTISGGGGNATFTLEGPEPDIVHSFMHGIEFKNFVCTDCRDRGVFIDSVGDNATPVEQVYNAPVLFDGFRLRGDGGAEAATGRDIGARVARAKFFTLRRFDVSNFQIGVWIDDNSERITLQKSRSYFNGAEGVLIFSSMLTDPIDTVIDELEAFSNGTDSGGDGASGVHDYGTRTKISNSIFGHDTPASEAYQNYAINIDDTAIGAVIQNNHCRSVRTQVGGAGGGTCWKLTAGTTAFNSVKEFTGNTHYTTAVWAASTAYSSGTTVRRTSRDNEFCVFQVTTAGTSAGSEPNWPCTAGGSVVDNTVTWHTQVVRSGIPWNRGMTVGSFCDLYTPTFTNVANVTAFGAATVSQYCRTGDTVDVDVVVNVTPNLAAPTATQFGISLPIISNLAGAATDLLGSGGVPSASGTSASVVADTTNDRAQGEYIATAANPVSIYMHFRYKVLP